MTKYTANQIVTRSATGLHLTRASQAPESPHSPKRVHWAWGIILVLLWALLASSCSPKLQKSLYNTGIDLATEQLEQHTPKFKLKFARNKHGFYHYTGLETAPQSGTASAADSGLGLRPELLVQAQVFATSDSSIRAELVLHYAYMGQWLKTHLPKLISQQKQQSWSGLQQALLGQVIDSLMGHLAARLPKLEINFLRNHTQHGLEYFYARDKNGLIRSFVSTHPNKTQVVWVEPFINYSLINRWLKAEGTKLIDELNKGSGKTPKPRAPSAVAR
ncbi:hypothetical protein [Microscilla marina]|uniref:Uncharacterized protein n=1 Tax=Microscilla marina ATCC 23134 TaxID=313606 RepID=A1ZN92_MICM2|nr:hypothetical protein [Microscilla marina]EAY28273.1 hypothetical protein M23134_03534 [Microscilla marina ATCC 23134]